MSPGVSAVVLSVSTVGWSAVLLVGASLPLREAPAHVQETLQVRALRPAQTVTFAETGLASFYATKYHGRPTASGELFDMNALTAAHPHLAFGSRVKVIHLANGRSVLVRINDRGPFLRNRVIDLSRAAAEELRMIEIGIAQVRLEVIQ